MYPANYSPAAHADKFHRGERSPGAQAINIYELTYELKLQYLRELSVGRMEVNTDIHQPYAWGHLDAVHAVVRPAWNNESVRLELTKLTHDQARAVLQFLQEFTP